MYRLYVNEELYGTYDDFDELKNDVKANDIEGSLRAVYVGTDDEDNEYEETYYETLNSINVGGNNDYITFMLVNTNNKVVETYKVEMKNLEQLGMEVLYEKCNEIKEDLKDLYYSNNGFIPKKVAEDLIIEKMN